jgi:DNA topoisomerase-2
MSVFDNGGIPVVKHPEHNQWIPELIFELRAGSNFNDDEDQVVTGQNGEGAGISCIFSEYFIVETCDTKHKFKMKFTDNSQHRPAPKITAVAGERGYTRITFKPEYERLGMTHLDDDNLRMLHARVIEIAATNPHLKVYWNGERVALKSFKDYVELITDDYVYDDGGDFKVAISSTDEGFEHLSFVNTTRTKIGGTHITYVVNQIVNGLREVFKKKYKVDVRPAEIKNHLRLFVDATIVNPRYSSQTKDELITEVSAYKTSWTVPDKFIQKLAKSPIVQSVLDWLAAKEQAALNAELRKLNKDAAKSDPRRVEKFTDALEKKERHKCELVLVEGDSARASVQSARGKNPHIGSFSLRGKPLNVHDIDVKDVVSNTELANILTVTGLQLGEPVRCTTDLRFGKIVMLADADLDGIHICSLLMGFFGKFWPELFELGMIYRFVTPVYIAKTTKGAVHEFFTIEAYEAWAKTAPKHTAEYYKGLGGFDTIDFKRFLDQREKYLVRVNKLSDEDVQRFELAFSSKQANSRKDWLRDVVYWHVEE